MGIFDGIEKKKASHNGGNFVKSGHYFSVLDRVKSGESSRGKGAFVAIEQRVLAALPDGDIPVDENFKLLSAEAWHRPGENITHLMMDKHESFLGNFKAFAANIGGVAEEEITDKRCQEITEGLFDGLFIEFKARTTKTRAGKPFTVISYIREVPAEEIKDSVSREVLDLVLGKGGIDKIIAAESGDDDGEDDGEDGLPID